jgi:RNA polymerase sigma-70 factor, ECF subfamily
MMDDTEAIAQCQAGNPEAYRHLVERYQAEAMGHALAILGHRQDAEDAVQTAFVKAWQGLDRFQANRRFYPWFYTILRNCCFKLAARRPCIAEGSEEQLALVATADDSDGLAEQAQILEKALWRLSAEERELIVLKHFDGLPYAELAERLGIPLGTVMSRLYHARLQLRAAVARLLKDQV